MSCEAIGFGVLGAFLASFKINMRISQGHLVRLHGTTVNTFFHYDGSTKPSMVSARHGKSALM